MRKFVMIATAVSTLTILYSAIVLGLFALITPVTTTRCVWTLAACAGFSLCMVNSYFWVLSHLVKKGIVRFNAEGNAVLLLKDAEIDLHVPKYLIESGS